MVETSCTRGWGWRTLRTRSRCGGELRCVVDPFGAPSLTRYGRALRSSLAAPRRGQSGRRRRSAEFDPHGCREGGFDFDRQFQSSRMGAVRRRRESHVEVSGSQR